MTPKRIIIHHSADGYNGPQLTKIDEWHKHRGFPLSSRGFYVGYHYLIEPSGLIQKTRDESEIGAHDTGENLNSIGICLAGDFSAHLPGEAQLNALVPLISGIRDRWNIPITMIEPHRLDDDTECPGKAIPDEWLLHQYLSRENKPFSKLFLWLGKHMKYL